MTALLYKIVTEVRKDLTYLIPPRYSSLFLGIEKAGERTVCADHFHRKIDPVGPEP